MNPRCVINIPLLALQYTRNEIENVLYCSYIVGAAEFIALVFIIDL